MGNIFQLLVCVTIFIVESDASRILGIFPVPSISHQVVFRSLMVELAKRGHEVVVMTPDPTYQKGKAPKNYREIDVHDISYSMWQGFVEAKQGNKDDIINQLKVAFESLLNIFEIQLENEEMQDLINSKANDFDLLIIEACTRPAIALSHIFKVPVIQFSSFGGFLGNFETVGALVHPIIYPLVIRQKIYNLTFWEKISELRTYYCCSSMYNDLEASENKKIKKMFGANTPDLCELKNNVEMLFLNTHPNWDTNRPVPPNVLYLGGLHLKFEKSLPEVCNAK